MLTGKITGRFFSIDRTLPANTQLSERAARNAWSDPERPSRMERGWCTSTAPYSGALSADNGELAYRDNGRGIWRLWIREEKRSVSRTVAKAAACATAQRDGTVFQRLPPREQRRRVEEQTEALIRRSIPKMSIVPLLLSRGWGWIGTRSGHDSSYRSMLHHVCGHTTPSSMIWDNASSGWIELSISSLKAALERSEENGLSLQEGVELHEVRAKGSSFSYVAICDDSRDEKRQVKVLHEILTDATATVQKMCWRVKVLGEVVLVTIDHRGVVQLTPPPSTSGFLHERISRRFRDGREAAAMLSKAMLATCQR